MRDAVQRWLGHPKPKQYCDFAGDGSLLEHAWARAAQLIPNDRILTVIGRGHSRHIEASRIQEIRGRILEQPSNRDTGPGIFLPLTYVMATDPGATIALLPSDHFISPDSQFAKIMDEAFEMAELFPNRLILLAAAADTPNCDYGWIEPGPQLDTARATVRRVRHIREKPDAEEAKRLYRQGCLWNTMITLSKAKTLWTLGREHLGAIMPKFELLKAAIGSEYETEIMNWIYSDMPSVNFSVELLERAAPKAAVMTMTGVQWSDWGRPERIIASLRRQHKRPSFLTELVPAAV